MGLSLGNSSLARDLASNTPHSGRGYQLLPVFLCLRRSCHFERDVIPSITTTAVSSRIIGTRIRRPGHAAWHCQAFEQVFAFPFSGSFCSWFWCCCCFFAGSTKTLAFLQNRSVAGHPNSTDHQSGHLLRP